MKNAYDRVLRRRARDAAISIGLDLKEGVYTMMGGPNFETPAELRFMHLQGIDAVGEKFSSPIALLLCFKSSKNQTSANWGPNSRLVLETIIKALISRSNSSGVNYL